MLVHRGTLTRVAHGVYRFPRFPVGRYDAYMLAVLWTRAPEAHLSHETALDAYGISDVNPNRIHVTVVRHRRLRRAGGDAYVIHYADLTPEQCGWWQEIPTGGTLLQHRLNAVARTTKDVDGLIRGDLDEFLHARGPA